MEEVYIYITDHSPYLYPCHDLRDVPQPKPYSEFILKGWHFKLKYLRFKQSFLEESEEKEREQLYPFEPFYSNYLAVYDVSIPEYKRWEWKSKTKKQI